MNPRGKPIRRAVAVALVAAIGTAAWATQAPAASHGELAASAKKCKKKHHRRKRHCSRHAPAAIAISPTSFDFGLARVGGETQTFTITNVGGATSGLPVPALAAGSAPVFSIAANGCTNLLPPGTSCSVDVHVATNGAGNESATLIVTAIPGGMVSASITADIEA